MMTSTTSPNDVVNSHSKRQSSTSHDTIITTPTALQENQSKLARKQSSDTSAKLQAKRDSKQPNPENRQTSEKNISSALDKQSFESDSSRKECSKSDGKVKQQSDAKNSQDLDAILARKLSSTDMIGGARPKKKISVISTVEEEPSWRLVGGYEELRRTKCRRLYSKLGEQKDLALFYRAGKFYAMEAWCSHMGGPLYEGDIEEYKGSCHVMCPWHAYMFELTTGKSDIGLRQQVFPVKCEDGMVYVEYICPLALYPFL